MPPDFRRSVWASCIWQGRAQTHAIASLRGAKARWGRGILSVKYGDFSGRGCVVV
ncbi:hypothetical protein [Symbiopectobacterium sp. RP]|uniref:hypothetical protein n=1 Tax=Symbiopectobacterium sp. RP TaxID=3248553 RepID=UPI003D2C2652